MAAPNFSKPVVADNYADVLPYVVDNIKGLAQGLDPAVITGGGTPTGTPTGAVRWNSANKYWEKYNGSTWAALESAYAIAISGNAGTVTNGVYTSGSYSNPAWITALAWSKLSGTPTTLAGYGISDAITAATAASTYAPLTGTGASGTWGINISGNAATATSATTAGTATSATSATSATTAGSATTASNLAAGGGINNPSNTDQTLTDGATINWNMNSGHIATVTLGGNRTMAGPSNLLKGAYVLHVIQDGTGSRTITWNSVFKWPGGVAPVLSTAAGTRDIITFVSDGTNLYGAFMPAFS